jgi:hypothetical protein
MRLHASYQLARICRCLVMGSLANVCCSQQPVEAALALILHLKMPWHLQDRLWLCPCRDVLGTAEFTVIHLSII